MLDSEKLIFKSHSVDNRDGSFKMRHRKLHLECENFLGLEYLDMTDTEEATLIGLHSPIDLSIFLTAPSLNILEIKNCPGLTPTEDNFKILDQLKGVSIIITGCGKDFVRGCSKLTHANAGYPPELASFLAGFCPTNTEQINRGRDTFNLDQVFNRQGK